MSWNNKEEEDRKVNRELAYVAFSLMMFSLFPFLFHPSVNGFAIANPLELNGAVFEAQIPQISIEKGGRAVIDLSEFFAEDSGAQYFSWADSNLSIVIKGNVATITPDSEYTGERYAYFYSGSEKPQSTSNIIKIEIR